MSRLSTAQTLFEYAVLSVPLSGSDIGETHQRVLAAGSFGSQAESLDGDFVGRFRQAAQTHRVHVVATFLEKAEPKPFNTALLIDPVVRGAAITPHVRGNSAEPEGGKTAELASPAMRQLRPAVDEDDQGAGFRATGEAKSWRGGRFSRSGR